MNEQMLERLWGNRNSHTLLVGTQTSTTPDKDDQDLSKLYFAHLSLASEVPPLRIYLNLSHIRLATS